MQKRLIVLVPGFNGNSKKIEYLKEILKADSAFSNDEFMLFDYTIPVYSNKKIEAIAAALYTRINVESNKEEINEIILAGHSIGTAILRRAFLDSIKLQQVWVNKVSRFVLLGAIGRGVELKDLSRWLRLLTLLSKSLGIGKTLRSMLVGEYFIAQLRIDWIEYNNSNQSSKPTIYNLLGDSDSIIGSSSVIDLEQFPNSIPITIQNTNHKNIAIPNANNSYLYITAFDGKATSNKQINNQVGVEKIFFFIHGIRDSKSCFEKVKKDVESSITNISPAPTFSLIMPTYGYLSALRFIVPSLRKRNVSWFIDQYAECLAANPNTKFYIAGHSNGTYIIGESLKNMPNMKFEHVYLAASVLPFKFEWNDIVNNKQIKKLRSDMGNSDLPVGVLCRFLNKWLFMKDIGTGGADGFEYGNSSFYSEHRFDGGHSAMLQEKNVESISDFLVEGKTAKISLVEGHPWYYAILKKFGDVIIALAILILVLIVYFLIYFLYKLGFFIFLSFLIGLFIFFNRY